MGATVDVTSNKGILLDELEEAVQTALERVCLQAESYAKNNCTQKKIVDTGNLRNSITHTIKGKDGYIGTNVKYGKYIEFGTGVHAETGGRQTPWTYPMETQQGVVFVHTNGAKPRPFLRPAVTEHVEEYKAIITDQMKKG